MIVGLADVVTDALRLCPLPAGFGFANPVYIVLVMVHRCNMCDGLTWYEQGESQGGDLL